MVRVRTVRREVRFTRAGVLLPWLGPALRGLVARPFKEEVCRYPLEEQHTQWRYCRGCPHMEQCPFGQTFEPDPPPGAPVFRGQEDVARPVVLAMPFPMPAQVRAGERSWLWVSTMGERARAQEAAVWKAVAQAGERWGFDPHGTTFTLDPAEVVDLDLAMDLPPAVGAGEPGETIRVVLQAPLFLRFRDSTNRRHVVTQPSFADLLRASLRTLGQLFALQGRRLEADFAGLKAAAERVPLIQHDYVRFSQRHWSNRGQQARPLEGVVGSGIYGRVPPTLRSWLEWGGRVHVGTDRVAGAGSWVVSSV